MYLPLRASARLVKPRKLTYFTTALQLTHLRTQIAPKYFMYEHKNRVRKVERLITFSNSKVGIFMTLI